MKLLALLAALLFSSQTLGITFVCNGQHQPVCGADGLTYFNICFAEVAKVHVIFNGPFQSDSPQPVPNDVPGSPYKVIPFQRPTGPSARELEQAPQIINKEDEQKPERIAAQVEDQPSLPEEEAMPDMVGQDKPVEPGMTSTEQPEIIDPVQPVMIKPELNDSTTSDQPEVIDQAQQTEVPQPEQSMLIESEVEPNSDQIEQQVVPSPEPILPNKEENTSNQSEKHTFDPIELKFEIFSLKKAHKEMFRKLKKHLREQLDILQDLSDMQDKQSSRIIRMEEEMKELKQNTGGLVEQ